MMDDGRLTLYPGVCSSGASAQVWPVDEDDPLLLSLGFFEHDPSVALPLPYGVFIGFEGYESQAA